MAWLLAACGEEQPARTDPRIEVVRGQAAVEAVDVVIDPSDPSRAQIVARGYLSDGCTRIDRVEVHSGRGNALASVNISTLRPAGLACIQVIRPFEERIRLDLAGVPNGTHVVDVNGLKQSFQVGAEP